MPSEYEGSLSGYSAAQPRHTPLARTAGQIGTNGEMHMDALRW